MTYFDWSTWQDVPTVNQGGDNKWMPNEGNQCRYSYNNSEKGARAWTDCRLDYIGETIAIVTHINGSKRELLINDYTFNPPESLEDIERGFAMNDAQKLAQIHFDAGGIVYTPDDDRDHWQTPVETAARGKGDCEDIAIYKYFEAREQHINDCILVVGAVPDQKQMHMVLMRDGLVYDNRTPLDVMEGIHAKIQPAYGFDSVNTCLVNADWSILHHEFHIAKWQDLLERIGRES